MSRLQLFHQSYEELLKLNICAVDKPGQLRFLYDKVSVNIRGHEALGVKFQQYVSLLIPIIMAKLKWQEIGLKTFGRSTPCSILEKSISLCNLNVRAFQPKILSPTTAHVLDLPLTTLVQFSIFLYLSVYSRS